VIPFSFIKKREAPCAGTIVGGYCWYAGTAGQGCTAVCTAHGGYDSATETFAGTSTSENNCRMVLVALGFPDEVVTVTSSMFCAGEGCGRFYGSENLICALPTSGSAADAGVERA